MDVSQQTALIVGGGPGISASCTRLFTQNGMQVAVAARTPDKPELQKLATETGAHMFACDASKSEDVEALFERVEQALGAPSLVIHNIDGRFMEIFRKPGLPQKNWPIV
jgi:NAD(P)-dependent dehydrogenase (short-subunit alcohol dehydrogenase family)